jgi:histidine triad (HIT) family protein
VAVDLEAEDQMSDCVFCKIVEGSIPATIIDSSERSLAFADISPRQPVHILVIPKNHHDNVSDLANNDPDALVDLVQLGSRIADHQTNGSFRFTFNTGAEAGQTVFHAHGHITARTPKEPGGN